MLHKLGLGHSPEQTTATLTLISRWQRRAKFMFLALDGNEMLVSHALCHTSKECQLALETNSEVCPVS